MSGFIDRIEDARMSSGHREAVDMGLGNALVVVNVLRKSAHYMFLHCTLNSKHLVRPPQS